MRKLNSEKVREFMTAFGDDVNNIPLKEIPHRLGQIRTALIDEEFNEYLEGMEKGDMVAIADALADILYVVYGTAHAFGIDIEACFDEVHTSNMTKMQNGKVLRRADGKIKKGKDYRPPDIKGILERQSKA